MVESTSLPPMRVQLLQYIKFILIVVSTNVAFSLLMAYISHNYLHGIAAKNRMDLGGPIEEFLFVVVFAPFLETFFLQLIPYKIIDFICKLSSAKDNVRDLTFIILASALFASMHTYNWLYVISAFIGGITLNYSYVYFKNEKFYPYLSVVTIHLLYNLSILMMKHVL